ncbi:35109_t:CDS:2, partial [Racocetra persica]
LFEVKDGDDLLDCGEGYTEIDIIVKTCSYIVKGLRKGLGINCKWGDSFCPMSRSTSYEKGRKCDVRFLSSSRTDLGEWEFSAHCTNAKAIGIAVVLPGRFNKRLLPGITFEIPTKLAHIRKLKTTVKMFKYVM